MRAGGQGEEIGKDYWQRPESLDSAAARQKHSNRDGLHLPRLRQLQERGVSSLQLASAECCCDPGQDSGTSSDCRRAHQAAPPLAGSWGSSDLRQVAWDSYMGSYVHSEMERAASGLDKNTEGRSTQLLHL